MPHNQGPDLLWPPVANRARELPSLPGSGNATFWEDICDVLVDPEPDQLAAETVHRWLRDEVEKDLRGRLSRANHGHLAVWACRLAPGRDGSLPCGPATPPRRHHRWIISILTPHKLRSLERQLARLAFSWQFRPVTGTDPSDT